MTLWGNASSDPLGDLLRAFELLKAADERDERDEVLGDHAQGQLDTGSLGAL